MGEQSHFLILAKQYNIQSLNALLNFWTECSILLAQIWNSYSNDSQFHMSQHTPGQCFPTGTTSNCAEFNFKNGYGCWGLKFKHLEIPWLANIALYFDSMSLDYISDYFFIHKSDFGNSMLSSSIQNWIFPPKWEHLPTQRALSAPSLIFL